MKPNEPSPANPPPEPRQPNFFSKSVYYATAPPTPDDDDTRGFWYGSNWFDQTGGELYTCTAYDQAGGAEWISHTTGTPPVRITRRFPFRQ